MTGLVEWGSKILLLKKLINFVFSCMLVFYHFSAIVTHRAFYTTKCDENHQKKIGILQYQIYWGRTLQFTCTFLSIVKDEGAAA